jgi:hypothetical protein
MSSCESHESREQCAAVRRRVGLTVSKPEIRVLAVKVVSFEQVILLQYIIHVIHIKHTTIINVDPFWRGLIIIPLQYTLQKLVWKHIRQHKSMLANPEKVEDRSHAPAVYSLIVLLTTMDLRCAVTRISCKFMYNKVTKHRTTFFTLVYQSCHVLANQFANPQQGQNQ